MFKVCKSSGILSTNRLSVDNDCKGRLTFKVCKDVSFLSTIVKELTRTVNTTIAGSIKDFSNCITVQILFLEFLRDIRGIRMRIIPAFTACFDIREREN